MKLYTSSAAWTRIKMSKEIKINSEQNNIQWIYCNPKPTQVNNQFHLVHQALSIFQTYEEKNIWLANSIQYNEQIDL